MDAFYPDYFYAFGVTGDPFKQPWPNNLGIATPTTHSFSLGLYSGTWKFRIDGQLVKSIGDSWRPWNATKVSQSVEILNEGDQIGGRPDLKQKFRGGLYRVGGTYYYDWTNIFKSGHCYPWASWTKIDNNDWNVWTEDSHTNC